MRLPPVVRCCACRFAVFQVAQRVELHWLEPRGRYRPVLCCRCVNRLWELLNARVSLDPGERAVMPTVVLRKRGAEQAH